MTEALRALRERAASSRQGRDAIVRVEGEAAFDLLDRALPSDLHIRNRGSRQALLLDEDGAIRADLTVLADGDDYLLLAVGLDPAALCATLDAARLPDEPVNVRAIEDRVVIDVDGPFAWQVLGALAGEPSQGLRYGSWFSMPTGELCLRAGQTGEYGYTFLVPTDREGSFVDRLQAAGQAVDLVEADAATLAHARLEAWFFDLRRAPRACPLEWGLQWRILWDKPFIGAAALAERRREHARPVAIRAEAPLSEGAPVLLDGTPIGRVAAAGDLGGEAIGVAIVQARYAQVGVTAYRAGDLPVRTVSPPFVRYRSLAGGPARGRYVRPT